MLLTDINVLKRKFEIDVNDSSEDVTLTFYMEEATKIIERVLDREISYAPRTVIKQGTGSQKMLLDHRPLFPTTPPSWASNLPFSPLSIVYDEAALWGAAPGAFAGATAVPLVYGVDYAPKLDKQLGGQMASESAILYRTNDYWLKPYARQRGLLTPFLSPDIGSYQVTYTAGYTIDSLPADFAWAVDLLVSRIRWIMPLGLETTSDSWDGKNVSFSPSERDYMVSLISHRILTYKNWNFGGES